MRDATPTFGKIKSSIIPNGRVATPQHPPLTRQRGDRPGARAVRFRFLSRTACPRSGRERGRAEVLCALVVAREQRACGGFQYRYLVVIASEGTDGIEGVEPGERDERNLAVVVTAQHVRAAEARNVPHRRKQVGQQEALVGVGVLSCRPAAPEPGDHGKKAITV